MLPKRLREDLFEKASVKTMRYVSAVPVRSATGLTKRVYEMIAEDFFVNGSLSSHSEVPELFAGTWLGGRELVVVTDRNVSTTLRQPPLEFSVARLANCVSSWGPAPKPPGFFQA